MMAMASLSGCGVMSSISKEAATQSTTGTQQDSKEIDPGPGTSGIDRNFHLQPAKFANTGGCSSIGQYVGWSGRSRQLRKHCRAFATDWVLEDGGKTWTFHLRDNVTWVDVNGNEKAKLTADDFMTDRR